MTRSRHFKSAVAAGMAAVRRQWKAGLVLWSLALILVLSYYYVPWFNALLNTLSAFRLKTGILFCMISTALAGGLFPLILEDLLKGGRNDQWRHLKFYLGFWAWKGAEVDLFYRLLDHMVTLETSWQIILAKTIIDMSLYTPFWVVPTVVLGYLWKDKGYAIAGVKTGIKQQGIIPLLLPVLILDWVIWIPAVAMIYCFPLPLQLPLQNIILCLWTVLLISLSHTPEPGKTID